MEGGGKNQEGAPLIETFCLCYFEFIFTSEQFCKFFLFVKKGFSQAEKLVCCVYFMNKELLINAAPNPSFKIRICGRWCHPVKSQESTDKWQVTAFCSTY